MIETFPLNSALPLFLAAHAGILASVLLAVFRPQFPAPWLVGFSALGYVTYAVLNIRIPSTTTFLWIAAMVALLIIGATSARWTSRLRVYTLTIQPHVILGAFLGLIILTIMFPHGGLFGQVCGFLIGASLAGMTPQRGRPGGSPSSGPLALYALFGPRGFQLILVLVMAEIATQNLLFRVGLVTLPAGH
jgi:hypothetical protein